MLSVLSYKNFRQEKKFLSDKMAEKNRSRELSTVEIQKCCKTPSKKSYKLWFEII